MQVCGVRLEGMPKERQDLEDGTQLLRLGTHLLSQSDTPFKPGDTFKFLRITMQLFQLDKPFLQSFFLATVPY